MENNIQVTEESYNDIISEVNNLSNNTSTNTSPISTEQEEAIANEPATFHSAIQQESTDVRFSGAKWYERAKSSTIYIFGCGGIGSNFAYNAFKLGPSKLILCDIDHRVDKHNIGSQFLMDISSINDNYLLNSYAELDKVNLLKNTLHLFDKSKTICTNAYDGCVLNELYSVECRDLVSSTDTVIACGFDNMSIRQDVFERIAGFKTYPKKNLERVLFMDGRMNAEKMQIYAFTLDDEEAMEKYKKQALFNDSEASEGSCVLRQTNYCGTMIGSLMTNIMINFFDRRSAEDSIRQIPFYTEYNGITMELITDINYKL